MSHVLNQRFGKMIDAKLRKDTVIVNLFNNDYEGSPVSGSVNVLVRDAEVVASDYDKVNGIAATASSTSYVNVPITQDKVVNEITDQYTIDAIPDDFVMSQIESAAYSLGLGVDTYLVNKLITDGTKDVDTVACTKANIYTKILAARTIQRKKGVPMAGSTLTVSPESFALILLSDEFIKASDLSQEMVAQGYVGKIAGYPVMESNNMPDGVEFILSNKSWCTYIEEWKIDPKYVSLDGSDKFVGASVLKGRKIYEAKITKPTTVYVKVNTAYEA